MSFVADRLAYRQQVARTANKIELLEVAPLDLTYARVTLRLEAPSDTRVRVEIEDRELSLVGGEPITTHVRLKGLYTYVPVRRLPETLASGHTANGFPVWALRPWLTRTLAGWLVLGLAGLSLVMLGLTVARAKAGFWKSFLLLSPVGCPALALQKRYREAWLATYVQLLVPLLAGYGLLLFTYSRLPNDFWAWVYVAAVPFGVLLPGWLIQLGWGLVSKGKIGEEALCDPFCRWLGFGLAVILPFTGLGQFIQRRYKAAWGFATLTVLLSALFLAPALARGWTPWTLGLTPQWLEITPPLGLPGALTRLGAADMLLPLLLLGLALWNFVDALTAALRPALKGGA